MSSQVMDHSVTIEKNRGTLLRCIDINVHIVACLRTEGVIDQDKESLLDAEKSHKNKLLLLLDWIKESPDTIYESFLKVMEENEQQHVANLLRGNEENNHVPLSLVRHDRFVNIRPKLMYMIHNNVALIAALISSEAISKTDAEDLEADKGANYKKNFRLINTILRRSDYSFECLCVALRETHQTKAADYLIEGEVIPVHINTTRPDLDADLSESLNYTVLNESVDETEPKLLEMPQLNGLCIVGASPSHSIVILVYCKTADNVVTFTKLFNSGVLQIILEDILNRLFAKIEPQSTEKLVASIRLDDEEVLAIEEITGIEDWMVNRGERTEPLSGRLLASHMPTEEENTAYELSSGWVAENFTRLKPLGQKYGDDAATQTDEESLMRTNEVSDEIQEKCKSYQVLVETTRKKDAKEERKPILGLDKEIWKPDVGIMSHIDASKDTHDIFLRCTHINSRIIACLRAEKALDKFQVSQLSEEKSLYKRNTMIFEWIKKSQALYDIFLRVMERNEQQHVSNLLKGIKDGLHIPLSLSRYTRLESITPKLMDMIRNDEELVDNLRAKHAISEIDRQDITQEKMEYKRNFNLIEAILRRSDYAFDCFEQALRETLQVHVANYLYEGQVVAVHASATHPEKDEVISELLNKTILSESKDDSPCKEKIHTSITGYNIQL